MALLLAESLLECGGFDPQDQVTRYSRWQREGYGSATGQCVGISANVARALAAAVYKRPLSGRDKAAVLRPAREAWVSASTRPEVMRIYEGSYAGRMPPEITAGGNILQALEATLWAFDRAETFREGALLAANLGRDSDVVASAYGQLAGAYYGVSAIPGIWRNSLMKQEVVIDTADRLLTHALVTLGG
jgi:ADP-ribosyl-[dinitrogen reductase] hydrolase